MKKINYKGMIFLCDEWVNYVCMDKDGTVWGFEYEPHISEALEGEWVSYNGKGRFKWQIPLNVEWEKSLAKIDTL